MAKYELMLILNPSVSEEERNNTLLRLKKVFEENSVQIEQEDIWWDKKMAYKINASHRGFYILYSLEMEGKKLLTITKFMNLDKNIWRHMFVKQDI